MGISLGVVGLGQFGAGFARLFKAHPLVDRVALCDVEPRRMAPFAAREDWQAKLRPGDLYDSLEAICRSDVQALVIITQPWLHAEQAVAAMKAGKHVYSAVPVVELPDSGEVMDWCDRLVDTCRRTGMLYMLGETTYYRPETMYCRRRAAEGAFGEFVYAEGEYFHDVDDYYNLRAIGAQRVSGRAGSPWPARLADYRARGVKGGPMHYPTHSVSGPVSVMSAHAVKVSCRGLADRAGDPFFDDSAFANEIALYQMSNGSTMRIAECRRIGHPARETFRLYGTRGCFENGQWTTNRQTADVSVREMRDPLPEEVVRAFIDEVGAERHLGGHGGSHAYLVHEFVSAVAAGRRPAIHAWQSVRYTACGAVAHQSALRDGEILPVPEWGDGPA